MTDGLTAARDLPADPVETAFQTIIEATEGSLRPGETDETPRRAAEAWREMTSGYKADIAKLFKTFSTDGYDYDEMIAVPGVPFASLCEHHLMQFIGRAYVVYIPSQSRIVGLSKVHRLVDAYARRLQVQERLTVQIADALCDHLQPIGVTVVVSATHSCTCYRGARSSGEFRTAATRGAMRDNPETRAEAMALIGPL